MNKRSQEALSQFSLSQTGLQRSRTCFQETQRGQQQMLGTHTSTRFGAFTDFHDISPLTAVLNLPPSSTKSLTARSTSTYASQLPTTRRQMDSANEQSRHSSSTSASTVMDYHVFIPIPIFLPLHLLLLPRHLLKHRYCISL